VKKMKGSLSMECLFSAWCCNGITVHYFVFVSL